MSGQMNRRAYEELIRENLEWLDKQPHTLEREHIRVIVMASADHQYGKQAAPHSEDRIEEAARELEEAFGIGRPVGLSPILQRLYDDGKKAGAEPLAKKLADAAMEINCAGPVDHRIRVLRRELSEVAETLRLENAKLREALVAQAFGVVDGKIHFAETCRDTPLAPCPDYCSMARAALDPSTTGTK